MSAKTPQPARKGNMGLDYDENDPSTWPHDVLLFHELRSQSIDLLLAIVHGDVKVDEVARKILADRGLDDTGTWVGPDKAAKVHGVTL